MKPPEKRKVRCCWPNHPRHGQRALVIEQTFRGPLRVRWSDGTEGELKMHEWEAVD
ncbi:MAG: hypothetical protein M3R38_27070 [Actinomycetota bacterium]|nr:hypothetical protein [Actinomycetota bacterium]